MTEKKRISLYLPAVLMLCMLLAVFTFPAPTHAAEGDVSVSITGEIAAGAEEITADVQGPVPEGAWLMIKAFDAEATSYPQTGGTFSGRTESANAGTNQLTLTRAAVAGEQIVVFLISDGTAEAVSQPAAVKGDLVISITDNIAAGSGTFHVAVSGTVPSGSLVLVKSYEAGVHSFTLGTGDFVKTGITAKTGQTEVEYSNLESGKQIVAFVVNAGEILASSEPVTVQAAATQETLQEKTARILSNCEIELVKEGNFKTSDTAATVKIGSLDESLNDSCLMIVCAYPGNAAFDPDNTAVSKRLWSGTVSAGQEFNVDFASSNLPLTAGQKVIAYLYVPITDDYYANKLSRAVDVVDESGQGFTDYTYPDAEIDEKELSAGTESIHVSLTGDDRLFTYAQEKKISMTVSVGMYPDGESFDFEGENQISLASIHDVTEPFKARELKLSEPLKEGYRVRAVVFWSQNEELYIPKGNDYEEMFHRTDDSVLVGPDKAPAITLPDTIAADAEDLQIELTGEIPEGAIVMVRGFSRDSEAYGMYEGTNVALQQNAKAGQMQLTPDLSGLSAGDNIIAYLQKDGTLLAESGKATVTEMPAFEISPESMIREGDQTAVFSLNSSKVSGNLNLVYLCPVKNGRADTNEPLARLFGQSPNSKVTFDISEAGLIAGDQIAVYIKYNNGDSEFTSDPFTILAAEGANSIEASVSEVKTDTAKLTVYVTGYAELTGGYLILTTGKKSVEDADSRTRLASTDFKGPGEYTLSFSADRLKAGETVLPHLYKYDAEKDVSMYRYGVHIPIVSSGTEPAVEPSISIATDEIREDRTDLWALISFDDSLTAAVNLYTFSEDEFNEETAEQIFSGNAVNQEYAQKLSFGKDKLKAGDKLIAVLKLSDGSQLQSEVKTITAMPEKEKPTVAIPEYTGTKAITAGDVKVEIRLGYDSSTENVEYALYQFDDTLDTVTAEPLVKGSSKTYKTVELYVGNKLKAGKKLQAVIVADGQQAESNIVTVGESPAWEGAVATFDVNAVKADSDTIPVTVNYADEYLDMDDEYYCDVTVYQVPGQYTDEQIMDEIWENTTICKRIAQNNSNSSNNKQTRGSFEMNVFETAELTAGSKLFIKVRLPNTEWYDEEVDYVSSSIPVIGANEEMPEYQVLLYHMDQDASVVKRLYEILSDLGIPAGTLNDDQLGEQVGYLIGEPDYEAAEEKYTGEAPDVPFMLMANLPETLLDRFLDEMQNRGVRIDYKAMTTQYNKEWQLIKLIGDVAEEHEEVQAIIELNKLVKKARGLDEKTYGGSEDWTNLQKAIAAADELLETEEPGLEALQKATDDLEKAYMLVTGQTELKGSPLISLAEDDNGTFTLEASVKDGDEAAAYHFKWSTGESGEKITGVKKSRLAGIRLTMTADGAYGESVASLQIPVVADLKTSADEHSVTVSWSASEEAENRPAATAYEAVLYDAAGNELNHKTVEDALAVTFDDLDEGVMYTVKVRAISPVAVSDAAAAEVRTAKKEFEGGSAPAASETDQAKAALNTAINDARSIAADGYTADSYKALTDAIAAAEKVAADPNATAAQMKAAADAIAAAKAGLVQAADDSEYTVTAEAADAAAGTAALTNPRDAAKYNIPKTVVLADGKTYKVTAIGAGAFTGKQTKKVIVGANVDTIEQGAFDQSGVTKLIVKTRKLTKTSVAGSLTGSSVKVIKVKVGKKKVNKKFVKKYRKIFTAANAGQKAKVK